MKNTLIGLFLLAMLFGVSIINPLNAQSKLTVEQVENAIRPDGKYAMSVTSTRHLKVAVETSEAFKQKSKNIQFEIVVSGPVLKELVSSSDLRKLIDRAEKANVGVVACAIAMKGLGIKKAELPAYIEISGNAAIYLFGLQELGFKVL